MNLFQLNGNSGEVEINPIAYELGPFKALMKRDKTKFKTRAKAEIALVWFYADYKSDFAHLPDDEKIKEITTLLDLPKTWKLDSAVKKAISFYEHYSETTSTKLLKKTRNTIDRISEYLEDIDFTAEVGGKPKYDIKKIADTIANVPKLIESLRSIEEKVREEQETVSLVRGDRNLEAHEDGIDF